MGEPIFKFLGLKRLLIGMGYHVGRAKPYHEINGGDVIISNGRSNEVNCPSNDGFIYVDTDGNKHFGFLYKRNYHLEKYGPPRMHICECETIREFRAKGSLEYEYRFAETKTVKVINMDKGNREKEVSNLPLCKYCIKELSSKGKFREIRDSDAFAKKAKELRQNNVVSSAEVDIFGYIREWQNISSEFKEKKNYTCEKCRVRIDNEFDRQFIHVHHKDGNKQNNQESNLQCLCIECHSQVNDAHRKNFSSNAQQVRLRHFRELYRK